MSLTLSDQDNRTKINFAAKIQVGTLTKFKLKFTLHLFISIYNVSNKVILALSKLVLAHQLESSLTEKILKH